EKPGPLRSRRHRIKSMLPEAIAPSLRRSPVRTVAVVGLVALLCLSGSPGAGQSPENKPRTGLVVWDTGQPSAAVLTAAALTGKNDWVAIPTEKTGDVFKGDAVLSNGRFAAVLRRQDSALEVHSVKSDGAPFRYRLRLLAAAGEPAVRLERMALVENTK